MSPDGSNLTELVEKSPIHFKHLFPTKTKLFGFKKSDKPFPVNEFNGYYSLPIGFLFSVGTKPAGSNENALLRSSHDRVSEVTDLRATYGAPNSLALKQDFHRDERVKAKITHAIYSPIVALTRNNNTLKPILVQKSLAQFFESTSR